MTITRGLITSAEYAAYIGKTVPVDAGRLAQWEESIAVASRLVERKVTGRQFYPDNSEARYFDPSGGLVFIDDAQTVTLVEAANDSGTYSTIDTASYQLAPVGARDPILGAAAYTSIRAIRYCWQPRPIRQGTIRVTGTWGWAAVPDDVKHATCIITQDLLNDPDSTYGGLTVTDEGVVLAAKIPARAQILLTPFIRLERTLTIA